MKHSPNRSLTVLFVYDKFSLLKMRRQTVGVATSTLLVNQISVEEGRVRLTGGFFRSR